MGAANPRIQGGGMWLAALLAGSALSACLGAPAFSQGVPAPAAATDLAKGFRNPPATARPRVWWHWMNGNITKDGIRKDIEWMSRIGIGGLQNFDAALATPQIVDRRLVYMTPEWKDAFRYAAELAEEKGLELTVAASPGWSETGGPWVPPQDGMKKLVWSELVVSGGKPLAQALAAPPAVTGPFQDIGRSANLAAASTGTADPAYYSDVAVLAFPLPAGAGETLRPKLSGPDGAVIADDILMDGRFQATVEVPRGSAEAPGYVLADFGAPRRVRSVSLAIARAAAMFQPPSVIPQLQVEDGAGWRKLADLPLDGGVQTTVAFTPVMAQRFRIVFNPAPQNSPDFLGSVPGAVVSALFQATPRPTLSLAELRFSDEERVDRFEAKAGFAVVRSYHDLATTALGAGAGIDPKTVVDLTGRLRPDGRLAWTPPPGRWKIVRLGYSLVGTTNHPAPVEATGLEVDKYDGAAVRRYLETYIGNLRGATGPDLIGARGLRAILTDSIEVGASNWTPQMLAAFQRLRGYDPRPWLPALTGMVVGSRADSDRFLFDFRATLSDLISSEHYGQVAQVAHANGLKVYGEALESGRPSLGDDLAMRSHADVPMAALWTYGAKGPRAGLLGDMKGAASVAHIYGQNLVAAESLTAAFSPWAFAPADLKPVIDLEFAHGVNRPVIHTSVHQPVDDKQPGLSLGPFGQYFNRHETWSEMARPWVDYLSRTAFMLQQGRDFADVAYFYGEDAPITVLYERRSALNLPSHYAFDFVNRDILEQELSVVGGDLVARSGARYRVLYLGGGSAQMTLPVLRRIAALAEVGATIVGGPPTETPSLGDSAGEFATLVKRLWSGQAVTTVGQGRVIASGSVEEALRGQGVTADFSAGAAEGDILFVHRRLADGDAYFLTNRKASPVTTEARFRVAGKVPEIWRADTGLAALASYRIEGQETVVPLDLAANDAVFVVFRTPTSQASATVATPQWRPATTIGGAWDVAFQAGRGAPATGRLPMLASLTENSDPAIRYFSGVATYTKTFQLPRDLGGRALMLDLGAVGDVAEVRINGQLAGTAWKAPYRLDIGGLVRPGANTLEVRVADLWVNRLIGDAQPGAAPITYTTLPTYRPDAPLRPSGLMGPVMLLEPAPGSPR